MIEYEKRRLSRIVRSIPEDDIKNNSIKHLWEIYGYEFQYHTFRRYLKFLSRRKEKWIIFVEGMKAFDKKSTDKQKIEMLQLLGISRRKEK